MHVFTSFHQQGEVRAAFLACCDGVDEGEDAGDAADCDLPCP